MRSTNTITLICVAIIGYQFGVYMERKRQRVIDILAKAATALIFGDKPKNEAPR